MTGEGQGEGDSARRGARTSPEWVTFGVATAILMLVVSALVGLALRENEPATPLAGRPGPVREIDGRFYVAVDVVNDGDEAAAEVQVTAELTIGGVTTSGEQVIDFLGGGESQSVTFVFTDDPATAELSISVTAFAAP